MKRQQKEPARGRAWVSGKETKDQSTRHKNKHRTTRIVGGNQMKRYQRMRATKLSEFTENNKNVFGVLLLLLFGRYRLMIEIRFIYFYWTIFSGNYLYFFRFPNTISLSLCSFFLVDSHLNHTCVRNITARTFGHTIAVSIWQVWCHYLQMLFVLCIGCVRAVRNHENRQ